MPVEVIESLDLQEYALSKLVPYFRKHPEVVGLLETLITPLQEFVDTVKAETDGTSISNVLGQDLDDIFGALFNVPRMGRSDEEYRTAILSAAAKGNEDGTHSNVVKFVRTLTGASNALTFGYANTQFGSIFVEGVVVDNKEAAEIIQSLPACNNAVISFDETSSCLMPGWIIDIPLTDNLNMLTSGGEEELALQITGVDTQPMAIATASTRKMLFPLGEDRAILPIYPATLTPLTDHLGNIIYADALETDPIEVITKSGIDGRVLANLPANVPTF